MAFYPDSLRDVYEASPQGWPDDGVEVSPELYERLYSEHLQGRVFCVGPDGEPMTKEPDPPSSNRQVRRIHRRPARAVNRLKSFRQKFPRLPVSVILDVMDVIVP